MNILSFPFLISPEVNFGIKQLLVVSLVEFWLNKIPEKHSVNLQAGLKCGSGYGRYVMSI